MILDERTEFADATALNTGAVNTYNIGDVIDLQGSAGVNPNATRDLGVTADLWLIVRMAQSATGAGASLAIRLVSDDTATPSTTTATVHVTSPTIAMASLPAGTTVLATKLPSGAYERYLGIQQITSGAAFSGGSIDAFLTNDPNLWRHYADNV